MQPSPSHRTDTLDQMMVGVDALDTLVASIPLTPLQRLRVEALRQAVALAQQIVPRTPGFRSRRAARMEDMGALRGLSLASRHPDPAGVRGEHALSTDEVSRFERDGVIGPFEVISPSEARDLADHAERWHEEDFEHHGIITPAIREALRRAGAWSLNHSGFYQAHRKRPLFDVISHPAIVDRLAGLLGEDVLCWRSQLFQKQPGAMGTFWHQNSVFREASTQAKLRAPPGVPVGMVQLTAWVALRDVTVANGAMRILPGTFDDARFEYMYTVAMDHTFDFLMDVPAARLRPVLTAGYFGSGAFDRVHAMFEATLAQVGPIFEGREVRDLTMRAGEAVIFSSLNMHASYPNTTQDQNRLALAGRYTSGDVAVFQGMTEDHLATVDGMLPFPLARVPPLLVRGDAARCVNRDVMTAPYPDDACLLPGGSSVAHGRGELAAHEVPGGRGSAGQNGSEDDNAAHRASRPHVPHSSYR